MNFQHVCFSATPALPYAPYTKRMMHISYFCHDRHIFVSTSYIAASSFRHCNVMAPSLCPPKSSIPRFFNSRSLHGTAILAIGRLQTLLLTIFTAQLEPKSPLDLLVMPVRSSTKRLLYQKAYQIPPRPALSCILPILTPYTASECQFGCRFAV